MIKIIIEGKPIPKLTHRDKRYSPGKFSSQSREKKRWQLEAKAYLVTTGQLPQELLKGPISLSIDFVMPILPSWPEKKVKALERGNMIWYTVKPDTSNLIKWAEDCLTGIVWEDDKQVVILLAMKYYGLKPLTRLRIQEIPPGER